MLLSVTEAVTICRLTCIGLRVRNRDMLMYSIAGERMAVYLDAYANGVTTVGKV